MTTAGFIRRYGLDRHVAAAALAGTLLGTIAADAIVDAVHQFTMCVVARIPSLKGAA